MPQPLPPPERPGWDQLFEELGRYARRQAAKDAAIMAEVEAAIAGLDDEPGPAMPVKPQVRFTGIARRSSNARRVPIQCYRTAVQQ